MSKWTPGPWKISVGSYLRSADGETDIARIYQPMGMPDEERSANARLIAAAPELAELLADASQRIDIQYTGLIVEIEALLARINGDEK